MEIIGTAIIRGPKFGGGRSAGRAGKGGRGSRKTGEACEEARRIAFQQPGCADILWPASS